MRSPRKLPLPLAALVMAISPAVAIISDGAVLADDASDTAVGDEPIDDACSVDDVDSPDADADEAVEDVDDACEVATTDAADDPPSGDTTPIDGTTVDTTVPVDTTPGDTTPVDTTPVESATVDSTVADDTTTVTSTVPDETTPVNGTVPVDTVPADDVPVDTIVPVDTTPGDDVPADTTNPDALPIDAPVDAPEEPVVDAADRGDVTIEIDDGAHLPTPVDGDSDDDDVVPDVDVVPVEPEIVLPADSNDGPVEPDVRPNLSASNYDGVYADGVPVGVAMSTSRWLESRGDYNARARGSTASGAYQIIDSTWDGYGGYDRAVDAPPAIQDQFAYEHFVTILKRHGNDVSKIPVTWYYPKALNNPVLMDQVPAPYAGNVLTVREYQTIWMEKFYELLGEGAPVFLPADVDPLIPSIAFPVLGPVSFVNDWHYSRDGGARVHEGLDLLGSYNQPLRAAFTGTVERLVPTNRGISGVSIEIRREDGTRAIYRHVNNDTPGTTDNSAIQAFRIHPDIAVGSVVRAGQIIGYMGDTGNAQGLPHLHFELRMDDRTPFAPYPAILQAQQREQCSVGIGPWSTQFQSPTELAETFDELLALTPDDVAVLAVDDLDGLSGEQLDQLDGVTIETREALDAIVAPVPFEVSGPDGALWQIGADGTVLANGIGALITPTQGDCTVVPDEFTWYGTGGAGMPVDLIPGDWWGDEIEVEFVESIVIPFGVVAPY